jgi:hypothetical protein
MLSGSGPNGAQKLGVRLPGSDAGTEFRATIDGRAEVIERERGLLFITLPAATGIRPCRFEVMKAGGK